MEGDIASTYYSEDKINFTFKTYVAIHHNTFNEMSKADNYTAPDGSTRVRVLLSNISSKYPTLCTAIASIIASSALRVDFEDTVDQLNTAVTRTNMGKKNNMRISAFQGSGRGCGRGYSRTCRGRGSERRPDPKRNRNGSWKQNYANVNVEDKLSTQAEYCKLTND